MAQDYDVVVIGAGPGGYVCAIRCAQLGLKTAIVERQWWGGVCLNVGCIPSKALLRNAEIAHILNNRGKDFGFSFENLQLDFGVAFKRSRQVSDRLVKGVGFLMKKNKIDTYEGSATIKDKSTVEVALNEGGSETLNCKNLVVATGASPNMIPGIEADGERVVTYEEAIMRDGVPKKAVIVGGGAIGVEFAYVWHSYGTEVTIVEMLDHLVPLEDEEVSAELEKAYRRLGINVLTGARVEGIETLKTKAKVKVSTGDGEQTLDAEQVLVAIGFKPNTEGFGLENTGIAMDEHGFPVIDAGMRTSVEGVYAIGDLTGKLMLAHVGQAQGIVCAETIAGVETIDLDYDMMPRATYCQPQVASFGYTEAQAKERGYEISVAKFPFQANGKALGLGERDGFVKLIADAQYGEILGAHMVGPEVTELLPELTLARLWELTPHEIARNVHAHPTLTETLMEVAHGIEGDMIHL
jgi:dihydrolipoamide dehydrogenase